MSSKNNYVELVFNELHSKSQTQTNSEKFVALTLDYFKLELESKKKNNSQKTVNMSLDLLQKIQQL